MTDPNADASLPQGSTGRQIVTFANVTPEVAARALRDAADIDLGAARSLDSPDDLAHGDVYFDLLNIAVVEDAGALGALSRAVEDRTSPILAVEPEVYVHPLDTIDAPPSIDDPGGDVATEDDDVDAAQVYADTATYTWGLKAVRAIPPILFTAPWSGTGIRIAVLDTGIDLGHPDFAGKVVASRSFVQGQTVQDVHGHGTHCAGTAAGPKTPNGTQRRYGVATGAKLVIGKVLSDSGSGSSAGILAGIQWAIQQGARVISMSLGSSVAVGQTYFQYYEQAAQAALSAGSLIVAAAGNDHPNAVSAPANSPSVLAVGALDQTLSRAGFSCTGLNGNGGEVNLSAPGVAVYSAVPVAKGSYGFKSGTSMATPHVAGIAAAWSQRTGKTAAALWQELESRVVALPQSAVEVGKGLAVMPVRRMLLQPNPPLPWKPGPIVEPGPIAPVPGS